MLSKLWPRSLPATWYFLCAIAIPLAVVAVMSTMLHDASTDAARKTEVAHSRDMVRYFAQSLASDALTVNREAIRSAAETLVQRKGVVKVSVHLRDGSMVDVADGDHVAFQVSEYTLSHPIRPVVKTDPLDLQQAPTSDLGMLTVEFTYQIADQAVADVARKNRWTLFVGFGVAVVIAVVISRFAGRIVRRVRQAALGLVEGRAELFPSHGVRELLDVRLAITQAAEQLAAKNAEVARVEALRLAMLRHVVAGLDARSLRVSTLIAGLPMPAHSGNALQQEAALTFLEEQAQDMERLRWMASATKADVLAVTGGDRDAAWPETKLLFVGQNDISELAGILASSGIELHSATSQEGLCTQLRDHAWDVVIIGDTFGMADLDIGHLVRGAEETHARMKPALLVGVAGVMRDYSEMDGYLERVELLELLHLVFNARQSLRLVEWAE